MTGSRRTTCRFHCPTCGTHLSSLNAFGAHRAGDHGSGDRHCIEPLDDERFAPVSDGGVCGMYAARKIGITIWTLGADLQRARERSGGSLRRLPRAETTDDPSEAREAA